MKIEVTDLSPVRKSLEVEAEPDEIARETETVLRRYASQARIPGFRPGKAPVDLVRKRFAKEIAEDVRDRLMSRLYASATKEKGLRPIGDPVIDDLTHEPGARFRFKTTFEVLPKIEPRNYRGVEAREPSAKIGEAEVDEALESLRQANARYVSQEGRAAETGDVLVADVHETPGDGPTKSRERVMVEVGLPEQLPAFNERILGAKAGDDLEFFVDYPGEHPSSSHAGKRVDYQVHVHEVKRREVPALDDEFAKDMGEFQDLAALRERLRADLEERKRAQVRQAVRQAVLDKVLLDNVAVLPEILVDEEVQQRLEDMVRSMILHGVDPRKAELDWKELRDRQVEPARKVVHARLVLDAIAEEEKIATDDREVEARIRKEAERVGEPVETLRARLKKGGGLEALQTQIVREKTLDFLTSVANIQAGE